MLKEKISKNLLIGIIFLCCGFDKANFEWSKVNMSVNDQKIIKVMTDPNRSNTLILSNDAELLTYNLNSEKSQKIFYANTGETIVDFARANNRSNVLVATQKAVYRCRIDNTFIEKTFSFNKEDDAVTSVFVSDNVSLVGTKSGLYSLKEGEKSWKIFNGFLANKIIQKITEDKSFLYILSDSQLISINKFTYEQKIMFSQAASSLEETIEEVQAHYPLIDVSVDAVSGEVVVAGRNGVNMFDSSSKEWKSVSLNGLPTADVNSIKIISESKFITGTKRGVFLFENNEWHSIYQGMDASQVNDVIVGENRMYAATDRGLFYFIDGKAFPSVPSEKYQAGEDLGDYEQLKKHFSNEPTIKQVHDMAIIYAEVHPDKIRDWRSKAKRSAWLPKFDVGVDSGWDRTIGDSVYGSSSSGGSSYIGPRDKSSGHDFGWDAGLSWDLSNLVWNDDQLSIDGRSKLMVELREEILNEITRIYFERRKVQVDILQENFQNDAEELQMLMRVDELTAVIDSLTGGEFSKVAIQDDKAAMTTRGVHKLSSWGRGSGVSSGG